MTTLRGASVLVFALLVSCAPPDTDAVAYVGATIWDGTGSAPIANATMVVDGGRIIAISSDGSVPRGAEVVELTGKFIMPGLIDTHGHVSGRWAPQSVTDESDRIRGDLELFAKYGVTTVNSLGDGAAVIAVRDAATPMDGRARLLAAGAVIGAGGVPGPVTDRLQKAYSGLVGVDFVAQYLTRLQ